MAALLYAAKAEGCPYEIVLVASNNPGAAGLALAAAEGVQTWSLSHKGMSRDAFDTLVDEQIRAAGADYVALAGYMRILSDAFVAAWQGRSEEHTSELQSLMRISYAVFCLKKTSRCLIIYLQTIVVVDSS